MSLDRRHVTNYAQWRSKADLEAFMADPIGRESIGEGSAICYVCESDPLHAAHYACKAAGPVKGVRWLAHRLRRYTFPRKHKSHEQTVEPR